jgi:AcrR family transcriptional regulator
MPKIVDWDERRDEILSATWRVIARDGITGATIRAIAKEANCSRGILGHYFDDKADILGSALVLSHRRVGARMAQASAGLTGLDALRVVMLEALPLDERRDLEAQIEISFWGRALGNARLRNLQHSEFDRLCDRLRGHLREAAQRGELASDCDVNLATHQLVVLIDGLSAERVLYPDRVTPQRQVEMLDHVLRGFRSHAAAVPERTGPALTGPALTASEAAVSAATDAG